MAFEMSYDDRHSVVELNVKGVYTAHDADAFARQAETYLTGKDYRHVLVDLSEAGPLADTAARKAQAESLKALGITHLAMINARPVVRMMGKVLGKLAGHSVKSRFFKNKDEAMAWFKKERRADE